MPGPTLLRTTPTAAEPPYAYTGRRLGRAVLGFVLGIVAVITLVPFAFARPAALRVMLWDTAFDVLANVALFVPLGFLYALTRSADTRRPPDARALAARTFVLGAVVSAVIETVQLFEPERYASPLDVATNAFGAYLGAWTHGGVARQLTVRSRLVGRLALEIPLMGLVYLLVPLCTLAALTVGGTPGTGSARATAAAARILALLALALLGGTLLGQVQRGYFGPATVFSPRAMAAAAAAWFATGAAPAVATNPRAFGVGVALAAAAAWTHGRPRADAVPRRRFELAALARAAPYLAAYVALLAVGDLTTSANVRLTQLDVLRRVEGLVAFAVLGYVLAEAWGRQELRYRSTAGRVALVALAVAPAAEALRVGGMLAPAELPAALARALTAAYGGWLYHLQRAHVRALVAARPAPGPAVEVRQAA